MNYEHLHDERYDRCELQFLFGYMPDYGSIFSECLRSDGSIAVEPYSYNPLYPIPPRVAHFPPYVTEPINYACPDGDAGPCWSTPPDSFTSCGCYPIVYMPHGRGIYQCDDGHVLCGDCAGKARDLAAYEVLLNDDRTDRKPLEVVMWQGHGMKLPKRCLVGEVYEEGPPEECGDCGEMIESAYGDPEAKDDDHADE
jgi:hypothetical protein